MCPALSSSTLTLWGRAPHRTWSYSGGQPAPELFLHSQQSCGCRNSHIMLGSLDGFWMFERSSSCLPQQALFPTTPSPQTQLDFLSCHFRKTVSVLIVCADQFLTNPDSSGRKIQLQNCLHQTSSWARLWSIMPSDVGGLAIPCLGV